MHDRVRETTACMLRDRGFSCDGGFDDYTTVFTHADNGRSIAVVFIEEPKLGINHAKSIAEYLETEHILQCIVVYSGIVTSFARNLIDEVEARIELFVAKDLMYNVTHHKLVPKHSLMSSEFKETLLKTYMITEKRLPVILCSDPVARYYGALPGNLFMIERQGQNTVSSIYYRIAT